MSNDDIVMANYSMLLEVYFLFMDINLSLSGISLALLCGRRDLQEETCFWVLRGEDSRAIGRAFYLCKETYRVFVSCFVFCFYKYYISHFLSLKVFSLDSCYSSLDS